MTLGINLDNGKQKEALKDNINAIGYIGNVEDELCKFNIYNVNHTY